MDDPLLIQTTVGDREAAFGLAERLVGAHLAACVQIVPGVQSVYRWKGAVQRDDELQLLIKSRVDLFDDVERLLREHHPYEVPEILGVPVTRISRDYRDWLSRETSAPDHG